MNTIQKTLFFRYTTLVFLLIHLTGCLEKPLTDADGNVYKTIRIGNQEWMAENLKTTRYNDGSSISYVPENERWTNLTSPGYSWFENKEDPYKYHFGALYNWYAAGTGKMCPPGWHVPDEAEWAILAEFLGGEMIASTKLREAGTKYWISSKVIATNESGFTALAGGRRSIAGEFGYRGFDGYWWTLSEVDSDYAVAMSIGYNFSNLRSQQNNKKAGFSIRCIKDSK
jgi:uncharacterized protein (TIGR02145 family)